MARAPEAERVERTLREIDAAVTDGERLAEACRRFGVSQPTYYRWRALDGGEGARDAERKRLRAAIIEAAKLVFLRDGYGINLGVIAEEAGVARQTLYNQFGSKEQLFRLVVRAVFERMLSPILQIDRTGDLRQTLLHYAHQYLGVVYDPEGLALHGLAIAEKREFPDLPPIIHALGMAQTDQVLAAFLQEEMEAGRLRQVDAALAAESFLGSLIGHGRSRAIVGLDFTLPERRQAMMELAVDTFLSGLAQT